MHIPRWTTAFALALIASSSLASEAGRVRQYSTGAPSDWVSLSVPPVAPSNLREASDGIEDLLVDRQVRVDANGTESYFRFAQHVVSEAGVEDVARITIDFDPESDRIELHSITVRRQAAQTEQLNTAQINVLRREDRLEEGLLDGDLTISILLEDIRVGDIVDYSYTRSYFNPTLGPRFFGTYTTEWSTPTRWSRLRLVHPHDRDIAIKQVGTDEQPREVRSASGKELTWEWRDLPGVPAESGRPSWHRQYPRIHMSEWRRWSDVVDWAVKIFSPGELNAEMRELVHTWEAQGATPADRIVLALRFVQDQVRYTGIEIGEGAYVPTNPARVLQRRFGDCKDKVMLLVTLLRAMNIDARPALVDTDMQHGLFELLPAPAVFDHAIVKVRHEGREYWFDATRTLQGGALDAIAQAHFGAALVVEPGVENLQAIPAPRADIVETEVTESFDLSAGIDQKGMLRVSTVYTGAAADTLRRDLQESTLEQFSRDYLNYYRDWYPTIKPSKPLEAKDERDANRIELIEHYELAPAFKKQSDGQSRFDINPYVIESLLVAPKLAERTTPLYVSHPESVRYTASVLLPSKWPIRNEEVLIEDPAFVYRSSIKGTGRRLTAVYEYRSLTDHVEAQRAPEYARNVARADDDSGYWLRQNADPAPASLSTLNLAAVLAAFFGIVAGVGATRYMHGYTPRRVRSVPADAPVGIRGWLLLPALQTCLMPIAVGALLFLHWPYVSIDQWNAVGAGKSDLIVQLLKLGYFCLMFLASLAAIPSVYAVFALFAHRRSFPLMFIQLMLFFILYGALHLVVSSADSEQGTTQSIASHVLDTVSTVIWIVYMLRSKRVAATFVAEPKRAGALAISTPAMNAANDG